MLIKILANGYYARQDTKTPVKIGIIAMVSNMAFNLLAIPFFMLAGNLMSSGGIAKRLVDFFESIIAF